MFSNEKFMLNQHYNQLLRPFNYKQCKCWSTHIFLRKAKGNNRGAKHEFNNFCQYWNTKAELLDRNRKQDFSFKKWAAF